jgi:hypothetical protein
MNENEKDFLKFYMEQTWIEMRHIETLRERVTILVITVASAIVGFIIQQKFAFETKPLVWFVVILGVFGLFMTLKMFQIHQMAQKRLDKWYLYYESFCGVDPQILKLRTLADKENKKDFFYVARLPHNFFWSLIHVFVVAAGIVLFTMYPKQIPPSKDNHNCCTTETTDSTSTLIDTTKREDK